MKKTFNSFNYMTLRLINATLQVYAAIIYSNVQILKNKRIFFFQCGLIFTKSMTKLKNTILDEFFYFQESKFSLLIRILNDSRIFVFYNNIPVQENLGKYQRQKISQLQMSLVKTQQIASSYIKHQNSDFIPSQNLDEENQVKNSYIQEGQWTNEENLQFIFFLEYFKKIFSYKNRRRSCHIFVWMAKSFSNKTARQCRCRHQKMMIKYKSFTNAKLFYQKKLGDDFAAKFNSYKGLFDTIQQEIARKGLDFGIKKKENSKTCKIQEQVNVKIEEDPYL